MRAEGPITIRPRFGLGVKLALCLVISTAAFFALFSYFRLRLERRHFERLVLWSAERVADIIRSGTRNMMLHNDRESLYAQIRDIGREPGIQRVRIYNQSGLISFSTDPREVGHMVDKRAEACYACHAQQAPLTRLSRPDTARTFQDADGSRTLAVIRPVENSPDCSNSACHAHPADRRILGVIDAQLSLSTVDALLEEHQAQLIASTAAAMVLISLFGVAFVYFFVHRPIRVLTLGTKKVSQGDLAHRLPAHTSDELGLLAQSFNKMTADLAQADHQLREWASTLEDRVQKKTAELERAHQSLVASEKMASLGKLAAAVAHEVNNPLFGMLTYARLALKKLQAKDLTPELRSAMADHLKVIERESLRCGELMKNLLTFARQTRPNRVPQELNLLVERALSLVRHQLELQEIGLETQLDGSLPALSCDSGQIQQVLLILMVNAADAMPRGGTLTVSTAPAGEGPGVVVRIRDTGVGILPEDLPKIFEPFFTTKENQQRTGLGLAIARSIVEQHAGSIEVSSRPGQGTEFTVRLPLDAPPLPAPASDPLARAAGERS